MKYRDKRILGFLPDIFLSDRLLIIVLSLVALFIIGFAYEIIFSISKGFFFLLIAFVFADLLLIYKRKHPIEASRVAPSKMSNGDSNKLSIKIKSGLNFPASLKIIDEFPVQFQIRNKKFKVKNIKPGEEQFIKYELRPVERGEYWFGNINLFLSSFLGLIQRRITIEAEQMVPVYPSFIQLKKYQFYAISNRLEEAGVKKIRKFGLNNEFEQIREYVKGDDFRVINWKATARKSELMVNQYQEEKSQSVYCIIDKGRSMHMPFNGLSLIDYAINSSLVMTNIALSKGDKAGLITFSNRIGSFLMAGKKSGYQNTLIEALYNQDFRLQESDYARLYRNIKQRLKRRSLIILYTNFESIVSVNRQIKYLRAIAKDHLLVCVIFENSELFEKIDNPAVSLEEVYEQTIAEKFAYEKKLIVKELKKYGIHSILSNPDNLTINSINKYLELKAKGMI